jgi:hemolysin activation/secretion protein
MPPGDGSAAALKLLAGATCAALVLAAAAPHALAAEPPAPSERERSLGLRVFELRAVEVEGPQLLPRAEVEAAVAAYIGRRIGVVEMRAMADALAESLERRGYLGSRVLLPDQEVTGGNLRFRIRAARLVAVHVESALSWNREITIRTALLPAGEETLHMPTLQERLALLRESGLVQRINASVNAFDQEGITYAVSVQVEEALPLRAVASVANNRPPGIGSTRRELALLHQSVLGLGDALQLRAGRTSGLDDSFASYRLPIPRTAFALSAFRTRSASLAIDPPEFRELDIRAVGDTDGAGIDWQWARSMPFSASLAYAHERRRSRTEILGFTFSFIPGVDEEATARVHRLALEAVARQESWSSATRLQWSHGRTNAAGDGNLVSSRRFDVAAIAGSWIAQLGGGRGQVRGRLEGQYTRDVLFPFEKISIGGAASVRGYRENAGLHDRGVVASVEWRSRDYPFLQEKVTVSGGVFADAGWGEAARPRTDGGSSPVLASVGVLARVELWRRVALQVAWAHPRKRESNGRSDAQDRGLHYAISIALP